MTKPVSVEMELTGAENDSRRQLSGRLRGHRDHQPQGLGRQLERAVVEGSGVLVSEQVTLEFEVAAIRRS